MGTGDGGGEEVRGAWEGEGSALSHVQSEVVRTEALCDSDSWKPQRSGIGSPLCVCVLCLIQFSSERGCKQTQTDIGAHKETTSREGCPVSTNKQTRTAPHHTPRDLGSRHLIRHSTIRRPREHTVD